MTDIKRQGWFGALTINGAQATQHDGTIVGIITEFTRAIAENKMRSLDDVDIMIRLRTKPIDSGRESFLQAGKALELGDMIEGTSDDNCPHLNESYEDYYARLIDQDLSDTTAEFLANQWFEREVNPDLRLWLSDSKAIRFRELNSRSEAYEAALPSEYESLKNYCITTYPVFMAHIPLRTA